jgi:hypothetical protein
MRLAAEQLREVAQGASPGNAPKKIVKLRSSDVYLPMWLNQRRCSAAFVYQGHADLRFHRRLPTAAAPQRIAQEPPTDGCTPHCESLRFTIKGELTHCVNQPTTTNASFSLGHRQPVEYRRRLTAGQYFRAAERNLRLPRCRRWYLF